MVSIPAGSYRPLFATTGARTRVAAFSIDREPVTRGEFLRFVRANPAWRKSAIKPVFAERSYLADWRGDLDAGDESTLQEPVRQVSWFAARAYCAANGKRLPTTDEWEYVASADEKRRDATSDPTFIQRLIAIYTSHRGAFRNVYGVDALHGDAWELTDDFNSVVIPDDSRGTGSGVDARDHDLYCAGAALGARDPSNYPAFLRSATRAGLSGRSAASHVGFRCAI
jgi:formylglycine-generating enzyme required for sulfatase activity